MGAGGGVTSLLTISFKMSLIRLVMLLVRAHVRTRGDKHGQARTTAQVGRKVSAFDRNATV